MEKCTVKIEIFAPFKTDYVEDQLTGSINGKDKIKYSGRVARFFKDGMPIFENTMNLHTWDTFSSIKRHKKNSKDSFHSNYYINKILYKDYICWYYCIEESRKYYHEEYDHLIEPKFTKHRIIPLERLYFKHLYPDKFTKSYFHHPNKEEFIVDTQRMINYFRKYLKNPDDVDYNWKEETIKELIEVKEEADQKCKEGGLVIITWPNDNE